MDGGFVLETFVFWFMLLFHLLRKMSSAREATGSYSLAGSISRYCSYEVIKNAPGSRIDVAGNHGVSIDGNPRKIKCKYNYRVIIRGCAWKHLLA